jgi:cyclohexadienyl dehydratase
LKPVFVRTTWSTLMSDYRDNRFDVAAGGISVTAERSSLAKFTRPYHRGGKTPIVRCGTEQAFDTLEKIDSAQVRVIVNPGGTNQKFADQHFHRARVIVFPDNTRIFDEIAGGRADVMVTDDAEVELQISHNPSLCRATKQVFTQSDKAWMLIDIPELAKAADDWLATHGAHEH